MMQPISMNNPNIHRGPSSSLEFNKMRNDMHTDLVNLFDIVNQHDQEIRENMDVLIRDNFFLQNKIKKMNVELEKIKTDLLYKEQGLDRQQIIKSMFNLSGIQNANQSTTLIDTMYGIAMIKESDRFSKTTYVTDTNEHIIPESLHISIMETNNTVALDKETGAKKYELVEDTDPTKAFDGSNNTFWVKKSTFPKESNVTEVSGIMHIKLPLNILNNVYTNTITLNPYPEYSMTIADVWYKGYGETWYRIPNYPTVKDVGGSETPVPFQDASKLIFTFPKAEITEIQIFYSQPYSFLSEGRREFIYGFQEIGIEYRNYNAGSSEFVTEFSIEGTGKRFYTIDKPVAAPSSGSEQDISDMVDFKLYYDSALTNEFEFGNEILAPIQTIYIKTIITKQGDITPVIKDLKLDYIYKDLNDL